MQQGGDRGRHHLALATLAVSVALTAAGEILFLLNRPTVPPTVFGSRDATAVAAAVYVTLPLLGVLVRRKRPENPLWWIFSTMGLVYALWLAADGYAVRGLWAAPGSLPAAAYAAWLANWVWVPGWGAAAVLFLRFPDGDLLSPRWRAAVVAVVVQAALLVAGLAFAPGPLRDYPYLHNPLGVAGAGDLPEFATAAAWILLAILAGPILAGVIVRLRQSHGVRREQMKWLAAAAALIAVPLVVWVVLFPLGIRNELAEKLSYLTPVMIPVAAGVAILRYRLYDIDRVVSRTLSYSVLTVLLAGVYAAGVLLLSPVIASLGGGSQFSIAGATLAVAAVFHPARTRIQVAVDKRFNRSRYDAQRTVEAFAQRLRDEADLPTLAADLQTVVASTIRPRAVTLWLTCRDTKSGIRLRAPARLDPGPHSTFDPDSRT